MISSGGGPRGGAETRGWHALGRRGATQRVAMVVRRHRGAARHGRQGRVVLPLVLQQPAGLGLGLRLGVGVGVGCV